MIASFPMYDSPATARSYDRLWARIRDHLRGAGIDAPDALTRSADPWDDWQHPDLLLSQTCGLPYRARLHDRLHLVAAPAWRMPDHLDPVPPNHAARAPAPLPPGRYYSVVVVRKGDHQDKLRSYDGARLAYNDPLSQSGWGLMAQLADQHGIRFASGLNTGSHRAAARAVATGRADIAAIDVATWHGPMATARWRSALKIIAHTPTSPALPFVTARPELAAPLFAALKSVMRSAGPDTRGPVRLHDALNLAPDGVVAARQADYMAIPLPPDPPPAPLSSPPQR